MKEANSPFIYHGRTVCWITVRYPALAPPVSEHFPHFPVRQPQLNTASSTRAGSQLLRTESQRTGSQFPIVRLRPASTSGLSGPEPVAATSNIIITASQHHSRPQPPPAGGLRFGYQNNLVQDLRSTYPSGSTHSSALQASPHNRARWYSKVGADRGTDNHCPHAWGPLP